MTDVAPENRDYLCIPSDPCGHCDLCAGDPVEGVRPYDEVYGAEDRRNGHEESEQGGHRAPHPSLPSYQATTLSDVKPERVTWLWPSRLPRGKLVTLDGDPDVGKSTLMLDIAARVSTGQPMPGEDLAAVPASDVVLMAAEDGLADTIRPRLDAANADTTRVHHLDAVPVRNDDGEITSWVPPSMPEDLAALEDLVVSKGAVLVVIDVLMAYLSGRADSHRDQDVRRSLAPLADMAARTGACIVLLRHLRKSRGSALQAGGGSMGIIGVARAGLVAAVDPDDETETRRVLARAKGNLAPPYPSLVYQLVTDEPRGVARVQWLGQSPHNGDRLLAPRELGDDQDGDDAANVLRAVLAEGPLWAKVAFDAMADAGFSKDQAKRAKAKLKVCTSKIGKPGDAEQGWQWSLPGLPREHEGSEERRVHTPLPSLPSPRSSEEMF